VKILQVQRFRQLTPASCTATVTIMIAYFFGYLLSPEESISLINSYPDGATLKVAARKLGQKFKIRHKWLNSIKAIEKWIDKGLPIASGDDGLFFGPHSILIIGYDKNNFYLADPNRADIRKANKEKLFSNSDEFYGVYKN